jgi:hypothetical protein
LFDSTALFGAAIEGHTAVVRELLEAGAAVDAADAGGWTPLLAASMSGHTSTVQLLLDAGAAVDMREDAGLTPLHGAAFWGEVEVVKALLAAGADVDARDVPHERTSLFLAAGNGQCSCVEALQAAGADLRATGDRGHTPLHDAASTGQADSLQLLLAAGAAVDAAESTAALPSTWPRSMAGSLSCHSCWQLARLSAPGTCMLAPRCGMPPLTTTLASHGCCWMRGIAQRGKCVWADATPHRRQQGKLPPLPQPAAAVRGALVACWNAACNRPSCANFLALPTILCHTAGPQGPGPAAGAAGRTHPGG